MYPTAQVKNLAWLATEERLLTLELAMLEDHGLTLPPETQPSAGLRTKGSDNLALDCAERHAEGVGKAETAALGPPHTHSGTLVEVGT